MIILNLLKKAGQLSFPLKYFSQVDLSPAMGSIAVPLHAGGLSSQLPSKLSTDLWDP